MLRTLVRLSALAGLAALLVGCGLLFPRPDPVTAAIARCDLGAEPSAAYRDASHALIDAARAGRLPVADDTLLVAYRPALAGAGARGQGARPDTAAVLRAAHGLTPLRTLAPGLELVRAAGDPWATAERLLADERVRYAHPNVRLEPQNIPNDARFGEQWNLASFGAPEAWDVELGSAAVTVAVLDSGLDPAHPDLAGRLEAGWDFYGSDPACEADRSCPGDDDPSSADVHGTHVAGIAGAQGGNLIGVSGVTSSGVRLLPVKVFDDAGGDRGGKAVAAVVSGLRWVAGYPVAGPPPLPEAVAIANLSLGTAGSYLLVPALEDASRAARARGVLVFASTGNEGSRDGITAPANGPCAVSVGSVDEDVELSWFSNYDASSRAVDLVAPGGLSLEGKAVLSTTPGGGYGFLAGTSMAAPFASGVAALLASHHPAWGAEEVLEQLLRTAYRPEGANVRELGFGVPCPDAALETGTVCGRP